MFIFYLCVFILESLLVRLTFAAMEDSNTISELDVQQSPSQKGPVFHEVVWRIRPVLKETNQQNRLQPA